MKKKIKNSLDHLKYSLDSQISPNRQKIIGALATVPFISASTMSGACAGGCPYGLVNDPYPGQCPRYIDLNGDGICDLSQSVSTTTTDTSSSSSSSDPSSSAQVDSYGNGAHNSQNVDSDPSNASVIQNPDTGSLDTSSTPLDSHNYHILPISLLIIGGYLFTHYLFRKGILKPQKHYRIWNLLLVAGYMGTGLTGMLLILLVNLGISTIFNPSLTYWHAELSILMVMGTLVHLHLYRKPFKNMFKVLFGIKSSSKKKFNTKSINMSK
ncbi:MAG: hypothetical protein ACXVHV_06405 [Methanobacterium sp.]